MHKGCAHPAQVCENTCQGFEHYSPGLMVGIEFILNYVQFLLNYVRTYVCTERVSGRVGGSLW